LRHSLISENTQSIFEKVTASLETGLFGEVAPPTRPPRRMKPKRDPDDDDDDDDEEEEEEEEEEEGEKWSEEHGGEVKGGAVSRLQPVKVRVRTRPHMS